jgi:hypothetical protein
MPLEINHPYIISFFLGMIGGLGYDFAFHTGRPVVVSVGYILMGVTVIGCLIEGMYVWRENLKDHKRVSTEIPYIHAVIKEIPSIHALICGLSVFVPAFLGAFLVDYFLSKILV